MGAKWGAIIGRHQAKWDLLKRSISGNLEAIQQQWAIAADSKDLVRIEVVGGSIAPPRRLTVA
jgi:hypothetical protein